MNIQVSAIFSNLLRGRHAMIVPFDGERVMLGKKHYVQGLPRFIGGGIDPGEEPAEGAAREFEEETGSKAPLKLLCEIPVHATSADGQTADLTIYMYTSPIDTFEAQDDLKGFVTVPLDELLTIAEKMESIPDEWFEGKKGRLNWRDWGALYGPIHRLVQEKLTQK